MNRIVKIRFLDQSRCGDRINSLEKIQRVFYTRIWKWLHKAWMMHFDKIDSRQIGYKKTWIFKSTSLLEHVLGDALVQKIRLVVLSFEHALNLSPWIFNLPISICTIKDKTKICNCTFQLTTLISKNLMKKLECPVYSFLSTDNQSWIKN